MYRSNQFNSFRHGGYVNMHQQTPWGRDTYKTCCTSAHVTQHAFLLKPINTTQKGNTPNRNSIRHSSRPPCRNHISHWARQTYRFSAATFPRPTTQANATNAASGSHGSNIGLELASNGFLWASTASTMWIIVDVTVTHQKLESRFAPTMHYYIYILYIYIII